MLNNVATMSSRPFSMTGGLSAYSDQIHRMAVSAEPLEERAPFIEGLSAGYIRATNQVIVGVTTAAAMFALSHQPISPTLLPKDYSVIGEAFQPRRVLVAMPASFYASAMEMEQYRYLEDGWDGAGSVPPSRQSVDAAVELLKSLPRDVSAPEATVSSDGVVGWFWDTGRVYATMSVRGESSFAYFVRNRETGEKARGVAALEDASIPQEFIEILRAA